MAHKNKHGASERVVYNGEIFRRYPESPQRALAVYFTSQRGRRLHRAIWEAHNGPIPAGWHVHHSDGNPLNNDPANLACQPGPEHLSVHASTPEQRERSRQHVNAIRPLASAWHGSAQGRAWHSQHGKEAFARREALPRTCEQCGRDFASMARRANDRFCSGACKSAWRRAAGVDDVQRLCAACGATFTANKYSKTRCCSGTCAWRLRHRTV
jgi:hypothetical protein